MTHASRNFKFWIRPLPRPASKSFECSESLPREDTRCKVVEIISRSRCDSKDFTIAYPRSCHEAIKVVVQQARSSYETLPSSMQGKEHRKNRRKCQRKQTTTGNEIQRRQDSKDKPRVKGQHIPGYMQKCNLKHEQL